MIKLQLFEETVVEWNSSDLVGKFIGNLGLAHGCGQDASHRHKKTLSGADFENHV
jgi:hypothetical protein